MTVTPEIQGLDSGVGLVPQGRLGSGIANVFDTNVATNLARLGARMENLDKLKLATAAKLAAAKEKEAVVKGAKSILFDAPAATGKSAFRSGNKVVQKIVQQGLQRYQTKKAAGDIEGANQEVPLTKFATDTANNKTASIESDAESFWKDGPGKFYKFSTNVEDYIENERPDDYEKYLAYSELPIRRESYRKQPSTYNLDAVGQWAKDESGRTTFEKKFQGGTSLGVSGISALFKLPIKDGKVDENANLEIDYDVAKEFYLTNPDIREQMQTFGDSERGKALLSEDYKNATPDQAKDILDKAYNKGQEDYIYLTLRGRADATIKRDLEDTYHRAEAQAKAGKTVTEDFTSNEGNLSMKGRTVAPSIKDPNKTQGYTFDYNFGRVQNFNFLNKPQFFGTGTVVVPMGDARILAKLGLITAIADKNGGTTYTIARDDVKFGSASYVQGAKINQTPNRPIPNSSFLMPTGMLLPTDTPPLSSDQSQDGYIINVSGGGTKTLPKREYDILIAAGFSPQEINQGLTIPIFVNQENVPNFNSFIDTNFKNTPRPTAGLKTGNR